MQVLNGRLRAEAHVTLPADIPPALLVPPTMTVRMTSTAPDLRLVSAQDSDAALVVRARNGATELLLCAADEAALDVLWTAVRALARRHLSHGADTMQVMSWHHSSQPVPRAEVVPFAAWSDLQRNYPTSTRHPLDDLMAMRGPSDRGRLLLWHGPPGTGKTTATTALISQWLPWCEPHVITDPERFFGDPGYLLHVLRHPAAADLASALPPLDRARDGGCKLVICEDADEYLRRDARQRSGPALGRLLNVTDGLLSRTSRAIVLLTTNDDASSLHPALTRPGRCLAAVEFTPFSPTEARTWLPSELRAPARPATLAELYAAVDGRPVAEAPVTPGAYL